MGKYQKLTGKIIESLGCAEDCLKIAVSFIFGRYQVRKHLRVAENNSILLKSCAIPAIVN